MSFDCCGGMVRTWEETQGGKFPPSDHSPMCANYKPIRYQRVSLADDPHSSSFIDTPEGISEFLESCNGEETESDSMYKIVDVYLTTDQFAKLGDFAGF